MAADFSSTLSALRPRPLGRPTVVLGVSVLLLAGWGAWFFFSDVAVLEISQSARLEVDREVHALDALVTGRLKAIHTSLGARVRRGDLLFEMDATEHALALAEEKARLAVLPTQIDRLKAEIQAGEAALRSSQDTSRVAVAEARAQHRENVAASKLAAEKAAMFASLGQSGNASRLEVLQDAAEAEQRAAAASRAELQVQRIERQQSEKDAQQRAALERLRRDLAALEGELSVRQASVERLATEVDRRSIRAPVDGQIGELARVQVGQVVREGSLLGAVVPGGRLRAVAEFRPSEALGRVRPGQPALMRLEGFPSLQYGAVPATVTSVATEPRAGRVRVELDVHPPEGFSVPLQHGLPGLVEVEVERLSPAALTLRLAGKHLSGAPTARRPAPAAPLPTAFSTE